MIIGEPAVGTFTFTAHWGGNTGTSDRLPCDCTAAQAFAARQQAFERAGMPA